MKLHRLLLDYDILSRDEVESDAKRLNEKYSLGGYEIEASDTTDCWHVLFPKTAFTDFDKVLSIAYESRCDKDWLSFCKRYEIFALKTELVKGFQPCARHKISCLPVKEMTYPVILVVKPKTALDLKRIVKLSENTEDHTWQWKVETPLIGVYEDRKEWGNVLIGCTNERQAIRRKEFVLKLEIDCEFEVKKVE